MSAVETEIGVGQCAKRPEGFGHVWAGAHASGDRGNPCRFGCGVMGRDFFAAATKARVERIGVLHYGRALTPEQLERAAAIVADKKVRDSEAVASGTARPGQVAGARRGK